MRINGNTYEIVEETPTKILLSGNGGRFWEVWEKRFEKKDRIINGKLLAKAGDLIKPSNEHFGTYAWCYITKEKALWKMKN